MPKKKAAKKAPKKVAKTTKKVASPVGSASALLDKRIQELGDWRGATLARVRTVIKEACPGVEETWKWRGTPVWEFAGMICTGETYKAVVKLTFAKGALLSDPSRLFNASMEGNARRAIDIREGEKVNEAALKKLIKAAVELNVQGKKKQPARV